MLQRSASGAAARLRTHAPVFAALGDKTRLWLVARLSQGAPCSISQLTKGSRLSRQAITKHLRVLESVGMVHSARSGRRSMFELNLQPVEGIRDYLEFISRQWDQALTRLKSYVEDPGHGEERHS